MSDSTTQKPIKSAHFIGIGGAGMSGIALVLHERGCRVSGSDLKASRYVRDLEDAGVNVLIGHDAANIDKTNPDVVVISTAIPDTNPEVVRAKELNIPIWRRAKMLAHLGEGSMTIAAAGTHGKTTTSSMVASMLDHLGMDPSFLIGGVVQEYGTNGRNGHGDYFVCEADESDGSFLYLDPHIAIVTNIEEDHLDHYGSLENIEKTFCEFMNLVGDDGAIIIWGDLPHNVELARSTSRRVLTYGFEDSNDFVCVPKEATKPLESRCEIRTPDAGTIQVVMTASPGAHNLLNATAALATASVLGCDMNAAAEALSAFQGAYRRFTYVGNRDGITVVDDYGHHPTEIKATLKTASEQGFDRIVTVFQPHRYTRTQALMDDFAASFDTVDMLVVMDIFPASEMPIPGISGRVLAGKIAERGTVEVHSIDHRKDVISFLCDECRPGDLVITQGAGDVTSIGRDFLAALDERDQ